MLNTTNISTEETNSTIKKTIPVELVNMSPRYGIISGGYLDGFAVEFKCKKAGSSKIILGYGT